MPSEKAKVKQADLKRYLKAAETAGLTVGELRIEPDGTVRIIPAGIVVKDGNNPCDRLLK